MLTPGETVEVGVQVRQVPDRDLYVTVHHSVDAMVFIRGQEEGVVAEQLSEDCHRQVHAAVLGA